MQFFLVSLLFLLNDANFPHFSFLGRSLEKKMERGLEEVVDLQIMKIEFAFFSLFCFLQQPFFHDVFPSLVHAQFFFRFFLPLTFQLNNKVFFIHAT
jgi:hypothetical protein